MTSQIISLKNNCRNRFSSQVKPSLSERTFTISDFYSPSFLQSIIFVDQGLNPKWNGKLSLLALPALANVIDQVENTFDTIKDQIDQLRQNFVTKLTAFYTDSQEGKEMPILREEMKKCHQRLLENKDLHPVMLENFVMLLDKYKSAMDLSIPFVVEEKISKITSVLSYTSHKLEEAMKQAHEICCCQSWENVKRVNESNCETEEKFETIKVVDLQNIPFCYTKERKFTYVRSENYYLSGHYTFESYKRSLIMKMVDLKKSTLVLSKKFKGPELHFYNDQRIYLEPLNFIIGKGELGCDPSNISLDIYRPKFSKIVRISRIQIQLPEELTIKSTFSYDQSMKFEILLPQHYIAICQAQIFIILNVLTRKIILQHSHSENIRRLVHISHQGILAVVLDSSLLVYDYRAQPFLLKRLYDFSLSKLDACNVVRTSTKANVIIFIHQQRKETRSVCGRRTKTTNIFYILTLGRHGVDEYLISSLDHISNVKNCEILIYPDLKMFEIPSRFGQVCSYSYADKCVKRNDWNDSISYESNRPEVFLQKNTLMMRRKVAEDSIVKDTKRKMEKSPKR